MSDHLFGAITAESLLEAARATTDWVRSSAVDTQVGRRWAHQPDRPEAVGVLGVPDGFYSGTAGLVIGFLELHQATGDPRYLADARAGGEQVLSDLQTSTSTDCGFYTGKAGQAWVLAQLGEATGDDTYTRAARRGTDAVAELLTRDGDTGRWSDQPGILFDAGAALYLVWAAARFADAGWLEPAVAFGRHLAALAEPDPRGGRAWKGMSHLPHGTGPQVRWPGFFYGTAGVGFTLARLAQATGEGHFLDLAQQAATNLRALAHRFTHDGSDAALVHYRDPDEPDLYYLGLCQGPVGTARLFRQLHAVTGDPRDADWVDLLGNGLVAAGAPRRHSRGYWNTHGLCCGGAGMIAFHLARWAETGEARHRDRADDAARYLVEAAFDPDGNGPRWYTAFNRTQPTEVAAMTEWGHGASGIATVLAQTWAAHHDRFQVRRLPDDPFASTTQEN